MHEVLESRVLFSAFVDAKGNLRVIGDATGNRIILTQRREILRVAIDGISRNIPVASFKRITIEGVAGNDVIRMAGDDGTNPIPFAARISGGPDNDDIIGGSGNDTISGDDGQDMINGNAGNDILSGDTVVLDGETPPQTALTAEADVVDGGVGAADVVSYASRTEGLIIRPTDTLIDPDNPAPEDQLTGVEVLIGGQGDDTIASPSGPSTLAGGAGDDTIDVIASGITRVTGGAGNDTLSSATRCVMNGDAGDDNLSATGGIAYLNGNDGDDSLNAEADKSTTYLTGGAGDDRFDGGTFAVDTEGNNSVEGTLSATLGPGNDSYAASDVPTTLDGGGGNDFLSGGAAADTIVLRSGTNAQGNAGDDLFIGDTAATSNVSGGDGLDIIEDANGYTDNGNFTLTGVEFSLAPLTAAANLVAASGNTPAAATAAATLTDGVLRIDGTAGNDVIVVGRAKNRVAAVVNGVTLGRFPAGDVTRILVEADAGDDQINLVNLSDGTTIGARVRGGDGNDAIAGSAGNDVLEGGDGNDTISAGAGNDVVSGGYVALVGDTPDPRSSSLDGTDVLDGGTGSTDVVAYTYRRRGVTLAMDGTSRVTGQRGERDTIAGFEYGVGGRGNDLILGSSANDLLYGGAGDDTLAGRAGADRLLGGAGADTLQPDLGSDYVDTGDDSVQDDIDATFARPITTGGRGQGVSGAFNTQDYFTINEMFWAAP